MGSALIVIVHAGLRDDFGVRVKSAVKAMREGVNENPGEVQRKGKGTMKLLQDQNKGVEGRARKDQQEIEVLLAGFLPVRSHKRKSSAWIWRWAYRAESAQWCVSQISYYSWLSRDHPTDR